MIRSALCLILVVALFGTSVPALAQSDTGEINIVVQDAASKAAIPLARVLLDGPVITSEFTGDNGKVNFTEVPDGIYRARIFARGFAAVTSNNFEVLDGRLVTVTVALAKSQNTQLRTIASEVVKSSASISTSSIAADSAQRKLSDTLADALGKLSGVTVSTSSNDSDATQTVSLEGQDSSQTSMTLDGIPMTGPGMAGDLNMMNSDLFTGGRVSFGPTIGGLAGGVNFTTLSPTLSWQSAFSLSAGSNGKNDYSLGESGSLGKLGVALMHTYRLSPSLLDGMDFRDASGLDYSHDGDRQQFGSLLKVSYGLSQSQNLSATYMHSGSGSPLVCSQETGPVPCGYGPGNSYDSAFDLYSLSDDALVGDTQVQATFFGSSSQATHDLTNRYIDGAAAPTGTISSNGFNGVSVNATLPAQQRHTISVNAYETSSRSSFTPLVAQAQPFTFAGQTAGYAAITVNDAIRSNTKLRLSDSVGLSHASNAGGSVLLGAGATWQPDPDDSYALSYNVGGVAPHAGRFGELTDPGSLRIDCNGDIAYGSAPGDEPAASSSTSARLSYTRRGTWGLLSTSLYQQAQNDVVLPVQVNGTALQSSGIFPPGYLGDAQNLFDTTCGVPASTPFGYQNMYFSTPIGNVRRIYEGAHVSGYFSLGALVAEPYVDVQVAKAISNDPRFANPYAITISGAQLPNVPLRRAGLTLDYKAPRSAVEWLADANYTGSNNAQNLPAYTTVDVGASTQLERGTLTLAASNIFNAYSGIFASSRYAVPYTAANGLQIPTIARPNTPSQISLTYTARFGQGAQQTSNERHIAPPDEGGGPVMFMRGGRGGGAMRLGEQALPSAPPADPFALNGGPMCTGDAQRSAAPLLGALKAYAASVEAAKTAAGYPQSMPVPNIPGVEVSYHGLKTTYALSIAIKQFAQMRPIFACSSFHMTDAQTAQQRNLYVPANGGMFMRPSVTFMPAVGLYFVRRPPQAGRETFRMYKLPTTAPKTPFALLASTPSCTADLRADARKALSELQAHFANNAPALDFTIEPHATSAGTWYSLTPADVGTVPALISCARVSAGTKDDLSKLGLDATPPPSLDYAPSLGLYMLMFVRVRDQGPPPKTP